jgi:hypothetical protein
LCHRLLEFTQPVLVARNQAQAAAQQARIQLGQQQYATDLWALSHDCARVILSLQTAQTAFAADVNTTVMARSYNSQVFATGNARGRLHATAARQTWDLLQNLLDAAQDIDTVVVRFQNLLLTPGGVNFAAAFQINPLLATLMNIAIDGKPLNMW